MKIKGVYLICLILAMYSCQNQNRPTSEGRFNHLEAIYSGTELELIQTDNRHGEWGGNTFIIKIYKNQRKNELLADYRELEGLPEPPPPPDPSTNLNKKPRWFHKPMIVEKIGVQLLDIEEKLIEKAITELAVNRIRNYNGISHSGIHNFVTLSDSSLIINDYPSIEWSNFQALKKAILK